MNKEEAIREIERTIEQVSVYLPADDEWIIALTLAIAALHAQADTAPNDPLTLEELRKMDGEPVWTVTIGVDGSGRWELCTCEMVTACPLRKVLRCVIASGR